MAHGDRIRMAFLVPLLLGLTPVLASGQVCFDYRSGDWPTPDVLPQEVQQIGGFALLDGMVAVVNETDGLRVLDLASRTVVATLPLPGYNEIAGSGHVVVLYDGSQPQAQLVDLADPAHPQVRLLDPPTDGHITDASVGAATVTLVLDRRDVVVMDLATALTVRAFSAADFVAAPVMVGDSMLLAGQSFFAGLALVDCAAQPADLRDWTPLPGEGGFGIAVVDTLAYVATQGSIEIVDLANPDLLVRLGSFGGPRAGGHLAVQGGYLYVNNGDQLLDVYDLADPAAPVLINEEPYTSIWSYPACAVGPDGVLKTVEGQLVLLPLQCGDAAAAVGDPDPALTLNVAPNPFNPTADISFALPAADAVTVEIYDVAGRLVRTLARDRTLAAGVQALRWDGRDDAGRAAASGVYLARVTTSAGRREAKMALVR